MPMEAPKPQEIRSKEEREDLINAPSLLDPEEETRLWDRFEKLKHVELGKDFRRVFETGKGDNRYEDEIKAIPLENFLVFLEALDLMISNADKDERYVSLAFDTKVKHVNGKTFEDIWLREEDGGRKIKVLWVGGDKVLRG